MQGSKEEAEEGTLVILAAGDKSLFDECQSCFIAMSKNSFYLGMIRIETKRVEKKVKKKTDKLT